VKELRKVFEACNPDKEGFISLHNFANIGRMYAGRDQVDRVVGLLKPTHKDKINFDEFCLSLSTLIEQDSEGEDSEKENSQPTFQENVEKSWLQQKREKEIQEKELKEKRRKKREEKEKNDVRDEGDSDNEEGQQQILGAKLVSPRDPRKKMKKKFSSSNMHRRQSQTRLTGAIPLVNTSSEDDNDLEDSFDRQIAAGLELAGQQLATTATKPSIAKPRYLVRGSSIRSTVRTKSSSTMLSLNVTHEPALLTPGHLGVSPIQPASGKDSDTSDPNGTHFSFHANNDTEEEEDENDKFTTPKSREPSRTNSPDTLRDIQNRGSMLRVVEGREDISETRSILEGLEHKLDALGSLQLKREEEEDGTFNKHTITELRVELEAEMEKLRIEARERLEEERERYREEIAALRKEMDLERRNSQLRLEHAEKEMNRLHQENMDLNNQLRVVCNERRHGESEESQMSLGSDRTDDSTNERFHSEYLSKIQQLMARLEDQDNQLITLKEDNVVLRNQKDHLFLALRCETNANKKRNFLGLSPNRSPRKDSSFTDLVLDDPGDIRIRIHGLHRQLAEQRDINGSLKSYLDTVLTNIMATNPELLEKIN